MFGSDVFFPATVLCALLAGMLPALMAGVKGPLAARLGRDEKRAGALVAGLRLVAVPLMLLAGGAVDEWGVGEVLIVGSVAAALGLVTLAVSQTQLPALGGVLLSGVGLAGLGTGSIVLMPRSFFPQNPTAAVNIGSMAFTLGFLLAPALGKSLVARRGLRTGLLVLGLVYLLPGIVVALTPGKTPAVSSSPPAAWGAHVVWLTAGLVLVVVPMELTLATWSARYLNETGHPPRLASTLAVNFWVSFLAGRLATGLFLGQNELVVADPEPWMVFGLAVCTAIVLGNMIGTDSSRGSSVGLILVGLCLGPVFPTLTGLALRLFPTAQGTAAGVVNAGAVLGEITLLPLMSVYARRTGPRDALRIPMLLALLLAGLSLVLTLLVP
jgi:fucose permease